MFYLTYLRQELRRRLGRTILSVLGLAVGVGLVVAVTAMSAGLDLAQKTVLGPLSGVATDLTVTRPAGPRAGNDGAPGGGFASAGELITENAALETDLSKLGKPGETFERDTFFATQLTFAEQDVASVEKLDGVAGVSKALTLLVSHQKGTIPKIEAEIETGGEAVAADQNIAPMTAEEREKFRNCVGDRPGFTRSGPPPDQGGGAGVGPGDEVQVAPGPFEDCLPERFKKLRATFITPRRIIRQQIGTPSTDISNESFTVTGIEPDAAVGLISSEQVTSGRFLNASGEAMVSEAYAKRHDLKEGSKLKLNDKTYTIVGLVKPPLGGQAADAYLTLGDLQTVSERKDRVNTLLVRASDAAKVDGVEKGIETAVEGSDVASAKDLADQVSGSLVDAASLARRLGLVLAVVALIAAFLIASLLTLSSVAKRVRELGTLKAIGWRQGLVVRQIVAESVTQGVLGGVVGALLGWGAASTIGMLAPELAARSIPTGRAGVFGFGAFAQTQAASATKVALTAPVSFWIIGLAVGLAVAGGLIAGAAGALRAARLRPADSMRDVG